MFEIFQCNRLGLVHETLNYDNLLRYFQGKDAQGLVNTWILTARPGEVLELESSHAAIICIE